MKRMLAADLKLYDALCRESALRSKRLALTRELAQQIVALRRVVEEVNGAKREVEVARADKHHLASKASLTSTLFSGERSR